MPVQSTCPGCGQAIFFKPSRPRKFCSIACRARVWVGPNHPLYRPPLPRIMARVDQNGPVPVHCPDLGPCWLWTGRLSPDGYGVAYGDGIDTNVHRIVYRLSGGQIPPKHDLDHLCRVRACCRPSHLEPVTKRENVQRGLHGVLKTGCVNGHPYDAENLRWRGRKRRCRACERAASRRYKQRQRARQNATG